MASRCISTLNDLDKISNRIHHKHSKRRFGVGIEAKLKSARDKLERSLREIDKSCSPCSNKPSVNLRSPPISITSETLSSRYLSPTTRSVTSEHGKKLNSSESASKPSTTQSTFFAKSNQAQHRKTKSCPGSSLVNREEKQNIDAASDPFKVARSASVFGKFNGKGTEYRPTAWFNLPLETSFGVIDSSACEVKKVQPLCYSINTKKRESVSRLLRHNLEVRVGQNGIVRTGKKNEAETFEDDHNKGILEKKRTAPLSWEELLHWQNACVVSLQPQTDESSSSKSLCETHPVIFHGKKSRQAEKCIKKSDSGNQSPSYKLSLDSRRISADRRNLVSRGNKYIKSVEIEDFGEVEGTRERTRPFEGFTASTKRERISNSGENIPKKVSFEDEEAIRKRSVRTKKDKDKEKSEEKEEISRVDIKTNDTKIISLADVQKSRPTTSTTWRERSRTDNDDVAVDSRKLQRPHTAPPAPPSSPKGHGGSRYYSLFPIKIPTSQDEGKKNLQNRTNTSTDQDQTFNEFSECETPDDEKQTCSDEEISPFSVKIFANSSPDSKSTVQDGGALKTHVTFGTSKSAPALRSAHQNQQEKKLRAKSSTAFEQRTYKPTAPVVVESNSSLELPKELPPAQALIALRKQIRDDLAQQNLELQLDIQRLYLKKHTE